MKVREIHTDDSKRICQGLLEKYDQNDGNDSLCRKLDRLTSFIDNALLGAFKTNEAGIFIYANKKIAQIFGFPWLD